jgi:nucleoside-diphosphate-sugar epimerase
MFSNKTFLITGATGRLGREITSRLEELGAEVLPLVLDGYPTRPKRISWTAQSSPIIITGQEDLSDLPAPDYVINLHWLVNRKLSFTEQILHELDHNIHRLEFFWNWLSGITFSQFVNISSIKIFSFLNKNPISADTKPCPFSPYGIAKIAAENFFNAFFQKSPIKVKNLRLCSVASFGEHPSQLMSQLYQSAFNKLKIRINSNRKSNILYIDDAVDLIISAALIGDSGQYILAPEGIMNNIIADKFKRICGRKLDAEYTNFSPGMNDLTFISDIPKLRNIWTRTTSLEQMIQNIISSNQKYSAPGFCRK